MPMHKQAQKQEKLSARSIMCNALDEISFTFPVNAKSLLSSLQKIMFLGTLTENVMRRMKQ